MDILSETEIKIVENGCYDIYKTHLAQAVKESKIDNFDQIRYSMAICYKAAKENSLNSLAFIGGIGVLGNLVNHFKLDVINNWRGTRDIDIILNNRSYGHIIANSFDKIDFQGKSTSIKHKMSFRGYSYDADGRRLPATVVDAYSFFKKENINIESVYLNEEVLNDSKKVNFYGVELRVLHPLILLEMKLCVKNRNSLPRTNDLEDINNLLGLIERENYTPDYIKRYLSTAKIRILRSSLKEIYESKTNYDFLERSIISPSGVFRGRLQR